VGFPFLEHLNGYVQYFAGDGESLADDNRCTNRVGLGVMLKDWQEGTAGILLSPRLRPSLDFILTSFNGWADWTATPL
jgi:hypothetical protein